MAAMKLRRFVKGLLVGVIVSLYLSLLGLFPGKRSRKLRQCHRGFRQLQRIASRLNRLENLDAWKIVVGCQLLVVAEELDRPEVEIFRKRLEAERVL
jgi:hypothetical protein